MNAQLPPTLAPYIQQCLQLRSLTLLTSVLDTPANWLLARFITAALNPAVQRSLTSASDGESTPYSVVVVSIWRSFDLWAEILKKCVSMNTFTKLHLLITPRARIYKMLYQPTEYTISMACPPAVLPKRAYPTCLHSLSESSVYQSRTP